MKILKFDQLDSTNNYAKSLIKEGKAEDGQLIYAVSQSAGRGQGTKNWESESGKNLTFSLIIEPKNIEPKNQFIISQAVSVGIVNYLKVRGKLQNTPRTSNLEPRIHIKFPNDILVDTKKIAGILIENTIFGDKILFSVIGVGLNVNQIEFSENAGNPTSLSLINNVQYDLEIEFNELIKSIVSTLNSLQINDGKDCKNRYSEKLFPANNPNIAEPLPLIEA
ncbi:MAG: biotin--[acetyl-CoA-carboxylase] ligase [Bacteroidales bacterium]|jgi:BirA family biotin operon repressor/biotin-[acetyl-CoA-carboxylase] ligase|nr:biotin--[acetyl-CoA-carboxylase] ligase [Bacteroidales bacterium]